MFQCLVSPLKKEFPFSSLVKRRERKYTKQAKTLSKSIVLEKMVVGSMMYS